jgi:hypothetical protein
VDRTTTVLESQVDWLTASVHAAEKNVTLEHMASTFAAGEIAAGAKMRPWRLMGHEGWIAGRVRYGTRQAAGLVQLSGDLARQHFDDIYPLADNVSRVDLAVTARFDPPFADAGWVAYLDAAHFHDAHPESALPWRVADADGGWTTYIGKRTSDTFLRIYDKGAESRAAGDTRGELHYAACWRYELETKGPFARIASEAIAGSSDRSVLVKDWVHDYLTHHGMNAWFLRDGSMQLVPGFRRRSDRESRLRWLGRSVRPAVEWLIANGDVSDVLDALGLDKENNSPIDPNRG